MKKETEEHSNKPMLMRLLLFVGVAVVTFVIASWIITLFK